jgi:hypothetical protein
VARFTEKTVILLNETERKCMKNLEPHADSKPQRLRKELQNSEKADVNLRRAVIGLSLLGIGAMTAVSLFQTGIIKHLPDGTLSLASLAVNIPLSAFGGENRAQNQPLIPIAIAAKTTIEAAVAGWYFYQMPTKEKAWCGYCILGAAANFGIAALTLKEAKRAWRNL